MKNIKIIIILIVELLILAVLFFGGMGLDYVLMSHLADDPEVTGHPAPVFTILLPTAGLLIMIITDVIIAVVSIIKAIVRKTKK